MESLFRDGFGSHKHISVILSVWKYLNNMQICICTMIEVFFTGTTDSEEGNKSSTEMENENTAIKDDTKENDKEDGNSWMKRKLLYIRRVT